jgi:hypothetical protein
VRFSDKSRKGKSFALTTSKIEVYVRDKSYCCWFIHSVWETIQLASFQSGDYVFYKIYLLLIKICSKVCVQREEKSIFFYQAQARKQRMMTLKPVCGFTPFVSQQVDKDKDGFKPSILKQIPAKYL